MICKRSNCTNEVTPNPRGPQRVYCCKACRRADCAMRERTRRGDEGRAMHAEANRRYRARCAEAREEQKARELAERVERINAKARTMMAAAA